MSENTETRCNDCDAPASFRSAFLDGQEVQQCTSCGTYSEVSDPDATYEAEIPEEPELTEEDLAAIDGDQRYHADVEREIKDEENGDVCF